MRIAFVSYEFPPATGYGGIGTYVDQAMRMLAARGHDVEAFAGGGPGRGETERLESGVLLHRIGRTFAEFLSHYPASFASRHETTPFDVVEVPEYRAQGAGVLAMRNRPAVAVKLHTPASLIAKLNYRPLDRMERLRRTVGALRRLRFPVPGENLSYDRESDQERETAERAEIVLSPSLSLRRIVAELWGVDEHAIMSAPNLYSPSRALLSIPAGTRTGRVTFVGKLEQRKGVLELAEAIPAVLKRRPETTFRFIGRSLPSPVRGRGMREYLSGRLRRYSDRIEFVEHVGLSEIPAYLAETDVCVFPSRWENFPNVCLEAMAAARGVVGSAEGGMKEMLDDGRYGELVDPRSPREISHAILRLVCDPDRRIGLGLAARRRVLDEYSTERLGPLYEACYLKAVSMRRSLCPA